ncbi:hypothetical protein [Kaistella antarctica]|nr:hypothetical protein [Kaistella antarctica]SEV83959.1 hypothetical protein SAMN05421765_0592 [Kaistella antarctica]
MKNNYTLNERVLKPKKQTIDFLLSYSQSIQLLKLNSKIHIVSKN